eukprot:TRINITY_DN6511_c0_g1_i1.p1 TRINITY_DN6511_c0_g1~~TRINITY_DN6511_c0_g1_i1.p1  ORF type:complete len:501 (+),score=79.84 TRINITY_DN6511_c0_g1_i1:37-1539(+)
MKISQLVLIIFILDLLIIFNFWYLKDPDQLTATLSQTPTNQQTSKHSKSFQTITEEEDARLLASPYTEGWAPNVSATDLTDENHFLYFVHIPKTGGMTFNVVLRKMFGNSLRGPIRRLDVTFASTPGMRKVYRNKTLTKNYFGTASAGLGHTDISLMEALHPTQVTFITFLRDPIQRLMSLYYFVQRNCRSPLSACRGQNCTNGNTTIIFERNRRLERFLDRANVTRDNATSGVRIQPNWNMTELMMDHNRTRVTNASLIIHRNRELFLPNLTRDFIPHNYTFNESLVEQNETEVLTLHEWEDLFSGRFENSWDQDQGLHFSEAVRLLESQSDYDTLFEDDFVKLRPATSNVVQNSFPRFNQNTTMGQFLSMILTQEQDNYMVRAYTGQTRITFSKKRFGFGSRIADELLQEAKRFLTKIPFFGLTERYDESVELLKWTFNLTEMVLESPPKRNYGKPQKPIASSYEKRIRAVEWADNQLYEFATRLFQKRIEYMRSHPL